VPIFIESHFDGNISECCVEFGALDRVLYNLLNNAGRHAGDGGVSLVLLPMPSAQQADDLRFIILNRVSEVHRRRLLEISDGSDDLRHLFNPGVSTTGSGLGLAIVGDLVANAYGLSDRLETLRGRYLGARLIGDTFATWFHWPLSHEI
jgi:signal transduction histidine kinase